MRGTVSVLLAPLNDVCVYVVSLVLSVVLPSARPLALTSGRRLDVSLLSSSLSLKVPQPPLVAPRRLLTSAAATMPPALGALSGLAELPRRRRLRPAAISERRFLTATASQATKVDPSQL